MSDTLRPLVSIIVPTRNSAATLGACLASIRAQTCDRTEVIVVDNHSTDDTAGLAARAGAEVLVRGPERSAQRNFGARQARGEYVVFIDSDMELGPQVIEACVRALAADQSLAGLVIPEESFGLGFWAACKRLERSFYVGVPWIEAARFFRREKFEVAGGYDEAMVSGEDWDLSQRLAKFGGIGRVGEFIRHNEGRLSLARTLRKKWYYAAKIRDYAGRRGEPNVKKQFSVLGRYRLFFSRPKQLFARPLVGLGMLFMKTAEFAAGGAALALAAVRSPRTAVSPAAPEAAVPAEEPVLTPGRLPISAVMVVHDEEAMIERALLSFADLVDDIVIVHDGPCSDRTLEIARRYTDKVIVTAERAGTAEVHRPFSYGQAAHDWVLEVDADEYLSPELRRALPDLIRSGADIVTPAWPTIQDGRRHARGDKRALFRRSRVYRIGATHEFVKPIDASVVERYADEALLHEPAYDDFSWRAFRGKWRRRISCHLPLLLADFGRLTKWNYAGDDWDRPTDLQLRHPVLVGMVATGLFHWWWGLKRAVRYRSWFFVKYAFFTSLYYEWLFALVVKAGLKGRSAGKPGL